MAGRRIRLSTTAARLRIREGSVKKNRPRRRPIPPSRAPLRERILEAAFCAFMENGYAGTSMLEVAKRAKVSKREIYAVCEDKAALLRDAIADPAARMRLPLELPAPKPPAALAAAPPAFSPPPLPAHPNPAAP